MEIFWTGNNINSIFDVVINQLFSNRKISNSKLETDHWIFFLFPNIIQIISKISAWCYAWRFLKKSHHQNVCKTVSITIIKMDSRILNIICSCHLQSKTTFSSPLQISILHFNVHEIFCLFFLEFFLLQPFLKITRCK